MMILAVLSAVLLVASFPGLNINLLAWVALIPLFFALDGQRPFKAFIAAYCAGVVFFLGTVYWLVHVTLPGMIVVVLYLAFYFGLFGFLLSKFRDSGSRIKLFLIPAAWVALEWVRAHLFTGFGWVLLAHSQTGNPAIIQIADLLGAYGVSFLIVLVNAAVYLTIRDLPNRKYDTFCLIAALSIVFLATAYGAFRMKNVFSGERLRVAVIQGNIPQDQKWDDRFREGILKKYEALTKEAARQKPDLVIWPETSVPAFLEFEKDVADRIRVLAESIHAPILVGAPSAAGSGALYNSAVLFDDDGKIIGHYDKTHLVPFGEYVPFKRLLSFVERFAPSPIGDFSAGKEMTVFNFSIQRRSADKAVTTRLTKKVRFSCLICFEDIFPELARKAVRNGAIFLVNITNDAWFMRSSAPYQHLQNSVFRAVENRVNVIRAANTGLSCFIDQKGEILSPVEAGGSGIFVEGFSVREIILTRTRTFYSVYGDLFAFICMGALALCMVPGSLMGKKGRVA